MDNYQLNEKQYSSQSNTNTSKIGSVKSIIFITISNILIMSEIGFYSFFEPFKNTAWIALLIYLFISIILSLLFCGFTNSTGIIKRINKHRIIKYIIAIYYFINILSMIFLGTVIIKDKFYPDVSIIIIYGTLLFTCIYIGYRSFSNIINTSIIFFSLIVLFYIISFTHLDGRNFDLLLPFTIDYKKLLMGKIILFFPLDNILFSLNCDSMKEGFSRKTYTIGNILSFVYLLIIFIDSITLLGANYFDNTKHGCFIRWEVYQGNKFIENYDVFLLVIMVTTIVFRIGLNINNFQNVLNIKKSDKVNAILFLIFFIGLSIFCLLINHLKTIIDISIYTSFYIAIIIYLYFIVLSWKIKHEKQ